eukprot:PITA_02673
MRGNITIREAKTVVSMGFTHTERWLHQLMFANHDYDKLDGTRYNTKPLVTVNNCLERGYFVVTVQCKDRPKPLFDIFCSLTDMVYVVFHATIDSQGPQTFQGLQLELCTNDSVGLLLEVTHIFRENGMSVTKAEVSTWGDKIGDVFYVTDTARNPVDAKTIEVVHQEIGLTILHVKDDCMHTKSPPREPAIRFSLGDLFKSKSECFLYNLGLIKYYS